MSTIRFFNGGRSADAKRSVASEFTRLEMQKKGKFTQAMRYKLIMQKKLAESQSKLATATKTGGIPLPGTRQVPQTMSKRAILALKEIAQKKAQKEAKAMRRMVIIQPKQFQNGRLDRQGKIFDIAGNQVGKIDAKDGKMTNMLGWSLGKYKAKSMMTNLIIEQSIDKFSPYFINLRKMQALQNQGIVQYGVMGPPAADMLNIYGASNSQQGAGSVMNYGEDAAAPRQNIGITSWGARADNAWGVFSDNTWGTTADNVWGTASSNVWGGMDAGGLWGVKGVAMWGTGNGKNYIQGITKFLAGLFGFGTKANRQRLANFRATAGSNISRSSAPTRTR